MNLKYVDGLIGFVVGDTLGIPLEGKTREELLSNPVTKMVEKGTFNLPLGTWSVNTSLLIATIDSINNKQTVDVDSIAMNFVAFKSHGHYTPYNEIYNLSKVASRAIEKFDEERIDAASCGSIKIEEIDHSSLIRMLPIAYFSLVNKLKDYEVLDLVREVSSITNAQEECILGCYIFTRYTMFLLNGKDKLSAYSMTKCVDYSMFNKSAQEKFSRIINEDISKCKLSNINASYCVVDVLESTLWVFLKSENYKESVIGAMNLGISTSEVAALTGALSGIIYGIDAIPQEWKNAIVKKEYLMDIFEEFAENKYDVK